MRLKLYCINLFYIYEEARVRTCMNILCTYVLIRSNAQKSIFTILHLSFDLFFCDNVTLYFPLIFER